MGTIIPTFSRTYNTGNRSCINLDPPQIEHHRLVAKVLHKYDVELLIEDFESGCLLFVEMVSEVDCVEKCESMPTHIGATADCVKHFGQAWDNLALVMEVFRQQHEF
jgi:hypothetical protein